MFKVSKSARPTDWTTKDYKDPVVVKQLKKDFDKWKKEAQEKIKLYKKGKLDEDTLYNWMIENK